MRAMLIRFDAADAHWCVAPMPGFTRDQKDWLTRGGSDELRNGELDWVYPEELDLGTAYWWAPDSSKLAVLQLDERAVLRARNRQDVGNRRRNT